MAKKFYEVTDGHPFGRAVVSEEDLKKLQKTSRRRLRIKQVRRKR